MAVTNYKKFPETPGVYIMRDARKRILYIGKAGNLRRRVSSYFTRGPASPLAHQGGYDARIEKLVWSIASISYKKTPTALEALILEAALIKKHQPPFNVLEKDNTSFLFVEFTDETYPRLLLVRGRERAKGKRFGPFTSAGALREALRFLRRIFPWSTHEASRVGKSARPCFEYELGLCPGTCVGLITEKAYRGNIQKLIMIFEGKMETVRKSIEREMKNASKRLEYEKAEQLKRQFFGLTHIQDIAFITNDEISGERGRQRPFRIEGYDVSNISGTSGTGSMVVFVNGVPDRNEYRKFKIQSLDSPNDTGMLREMLSRRFARRDWMLPDLLLIDGGKGQVNVAKKTLLEAGFKIPVLGIAKGRTRKKNEFVGSIPESVSEKTLIAVRDEAHRFAISYHRRLRRVATLR